ncbi:hypothetical protein [Mucilaginibacter gilvus]|uniref:Uncharacterized protein n=1 Tax=Mucilaginibacter gilvus TaxID=2305909 RepID=A0A444MHU1_9SPHI|nr:hypothetical protein [Mucilaginibacter gilvus]RWY47239.1 hypothetical protein EPL05_22400 [Mucilaginibacter gilvus]
MKDYIRKNKEILPPIMVFIVITASLLILRYSLKVDSDYNKNLLLASGFGITILSWFVVGYIIMKMRKKEID